MCMNKLALEPMRGLSAALLAAVFAFPPMHGSAAFRFGSITNAATGTMTTLSLVPPGAAASADSVTMTPDAERRYPMFVIDLNPDETRLWHHFELKASTNNFTHATASNMLFFTASTCNGTPGREFALGYEYDWCRLYVLSRRTAGGSGDPRSWTRIRNTGDFGNYAPLAVAVIVDPAMLRRGQGAEWLRADNDDIVWSYNRIGLEDHETDLAGDSCWRPAAPVRWYARLPQWANQEATEFDSSGVQPYGGTP